jgi:hypothetical protein
MPRKIELTVRPTMECNRFTVDANEVRIKAKGDIPAYVLRRMGSYMDNLVEYPRTLRGPVTYGQNDTFNVHLKVGGKRDVMSFKFDDEGDLIIRKDHDLGHAEDRPRRGR